MSGVPRTSTADLFSGDTIESHRIHSSSDYSSLSHSNPNHIRPNHNSPSHNRPVPEPTTESGQRAGVDAVQAAQTVVKKEALHGLLRRPDIWQGFRSDSIGNRRTGHALLDRHLPGRGWPEAGLIELLYPRPGIGEMQLLAPTLRGVAQCWVAPPWRPYAPALAQTGIDPSQLLILQPENVEDTLWALEQVLRARSEEVVLGWCAQASMAALRRLQLVAESTQTRLFLFRPARVQSQSSPASLRLCLQAADSGLHIHILKSRGGRPATFVLSWDEGGAAHPRSRFNPMPLLPTTAISHHALAQSVPASASAARSGSFAA